MQRIPWLARVNIRFTVRQFGSNHAQRTQTQTASSAAVAGTERVRWFYATDVPIAKPPHFHYKPKSEAKKYTAFSAYDSTKLEEAYQEYGNAVERKIQVKEDGLFNVELKSRRLSPVFWPGPEYQVRRGTWFYSSDMPCSEELATEVENLYKSLGGAHDTTGCTAHEHDEKKVYALTSVKSKVKFTKDLTAAYLMDEEESALSKLANLTGKKITRGYAEKEADEDEDGVWSALNSKIESIIDPKTMESNTEKSMAVQMKYDYNDDNKREVDHLVLCVHGIGQKLSQKIESVNFVHDINIFRKLLREVFNKSDELQHSLKPSNSLKPAESKKKLKNNKVQVLPVLWRQDIMFDMTREDVDKTANTVTLEDITVDGVTALRSIAGDVILDVLLYHQPHYRKQIVEAVTLSLNRTVRKFTQLNNGVKPRISLIGHSLGSAIVYDILQKDHAYSGSKDPSSEGLEFTVEKYFALGSPLGLFKLLENVDPISNKAKTGSIYNVFHPCDPIAYRLEPLIDARAAQMRPAAVPYVQGGLKTQLEELSSFGQKISKSAGDIWTSMTSPWLKTEMRQPENSSSSDEQRISKSEQQQVIRKLEKLNPKGRVDYVLQEGVLDISLIAAIASHMSYFENEDVATFILKQLYK